MIMMMIMVSYACIIKLMNHPRKERCRINGRNKQNISSLFSTCSLTPGASARDIRAPCECRDHTASVENMLPEGRNLPPGQFLHFGEADAE